MPRTRQSVQDYKRFRYQFTHAGTPPVLSPTLTLASSHGTTLPEGGGCGVNSRRPVIWQRSRWVGGDRAVGRC
jgi:hypothetical protein